MTPLVVLSQLQRQGRLHRFGWQGRTDKRVMDPRPDIPIDKEVHAQQRDEIRQGPSEARLQLQVFEQQQRNQGGPDLRMEGVGRGADKCLHAQILFERFEKELDLPSILVDARDGGGAQCQVIRQEFKPVPGRRLQDHATQQSRVLATAQAAAESYGLVRYDPAVLRERAPLDDAVARGIFNRVTK